MMASNRSLPAVFLYRLGFFKSLLKTIPLVKIKCVDSKNRPNDFPISKWVEFDEYYSVNFITHVLPQNILAVSLYELPLDETCYPYKYFALSRFSVEPFDMDELMQMFKDIADALPESVLSELLQNSNLVVK